MMELEDIKKSLEPICRELGVRRLDAFGSFARGTATEGSDLDLLVEFQNPSDHPARNFFGLLHGIEDTLNCRVHLLTLAGLRNPYFWKRVLRERVPLYQDYS